MADAFWAGRRVFLTGHTGFKGGWLALWLSDLGAKVHGYALPAPTQPSLFNAARIADQLDGSVLADIRNEPALAAALDHARPEIVFHMAAQPLVRQSYAEPVDTYAVNVMGVVNLFEAVRRRPEVRAVVNVTTDKVYDNREWVWGYREDEPLGGRDPYSSSKACAELVTHAYRESFLAGAGVRVASARAGNVIGGGDWAPDRLVPDALRALDAGRELVIRNPAATRPWQHVLEPLSGYVALAQALIDGDNGVAQGWNFGPSDDDARSVGWMLERIQALAPTLRWRVEGQGPHEAGLLKLDSSMARSRLGWRPRWTAEEAVAQTLEWHSAWARGDDMQSVCRRQIAAYENAAGR